MILAASEERRVPVEVKRFEILYNVLEGDPKGASHLFLGGINGRFVLLPRRLLLHLDGGRRAHTRPSEALTPRILQEHAPDTVFDGQVQYGVVVLAGEPKSLFLLWRQPASPQRDYDIVEVVCLFYPVPRLIQLNIVTLQEDLLGYPACQDPEIGARVAPWEVVPAPDL